MISNTVQWTCPTCRTGVSTPYCPACGEQRPQSRDLTLRGMIGQAVEAFTSLDARLLRTVRTLISAPGALTNFYKDGPRKPYIGPFAFFLLMNVLFVALEALTGSNIFSSPLASHLHNQPWSVLAERVVNHRLETLQSTLEAYAPVFDQAVAAKAKSLVALMVVPFALLQAIVFRRRQLPFAVHLAFSLHFHAFLLLAISASLVFVAVDIAFGGAGIASRLLDNSIAIGLLIACGVYLFLSTKTVYATTGAPRFFTVAALLAATVAIFLGYRFLLLFVTLYST